MLELKVTLNADKVKRLLAEAPDALHAAIEKGSTKLLSEMQKTAQQILEKHSPHPAVAFGNLVRGIDFEVFHNPPLLGGLLFVKPPADTYALPVEEGARPHWLPLEAIANYRKARTKKDGTQRQLKSQIQAPVALLPWVKKKFPGIAQEEAVPFAFAVRASIAKKGTFGGPGKGVRFFGRTLAAHEDDAPATYEFFLDEAIGKLEAQS